MTLSTLLDRAAVEHPDRVCVIAPSRTWTYAEASEDAGRMAAALVSQNVGPGDRVGVHLHKSAEGWIAMHAVVRAGAVAVPLDPGSPVHRIRRICETMAIDVVVAHDQRASSVAELVASGSITTVVGLTKPQDGVTTVTIEQVAGMAPLEPVTVSSSDPAYIITTSGSTGEPKGIVHTHASALAYAAESVELYGVHAADRVADTAPNHFDQSTFALWSAVLGGASVVIMPEPHQRMPASFSERLESEAVTIWYGVPFLLQQLVLRGDLANRDLGALRWVKFGGEVPPPSVIAEMMRHAPNATMANIYGPAECNQCSFHHLQAPPVNAGIPIGETTPSAEMRLGDPGSDLPAVVGALETGEIWVSGPTLMEGYFAMPEVNAAKIVEFEGRRWYRTGDLGRVDADGVWWFVGRADHQVKVRGHRIELEGLEAELEALPYVEHVVAAVDRPGEGQDSVVVGVFALEGFEPEEFAAGTRAALPAYAQPSQILTLSGKKFTGSGKLDRGALRAVLLERMETER
jgi:amino acid adenylation domain-containing protein